ncbi:MAG: hypothetical protein IIX68_01730, partial [Clostridia bacterium]|nr:hypothetical protein [Clostridia bacterium]
SETIRYCDSFEEFPLVNVTKDLGTTFHAFGKKTADNGAQIDYIYTDCATAEKSYTVEKWTDEQDGVFLSDHYPIALIIE